MTGMVANLLLNLLIIGLLAATISYCWILNRRIKILQDSKSELALLLSHFDESTQRASETIVALQSASKRIGDNIQHRIEKANYLIDDLSFMIERGNKLASQMEAGFAVSRARSKVASENTKPKIQKNIRLDDEENVELKKTVGKTVSHKEKTVSSLEAVLDRVVGRSKKIAPENSIQKKSSDVAAVRGRSKAEQELLDMLKVGIKG